MPHFRGIAKGGLYPTIKIEKINILFKYSIKVQSTISAVPNQLISIYSYALARNTIAVQSTGSSNFNVHIMICKVIDLK